jgi:hypothetical protein
MAVVIEDHRQDDDASLTPALNSAAMTLVAQLVHPANRGSTAGQN